MTSIYEMKKRDVVDTPLLLFDCELASGLWERWSTHQVAAGGNTYKARVLKHNLFDVRAGSEDGVDGIVKLSLTLANPDSYFSQIERSTGWKGAKLTVRFQFFDVNTGQPSSDEVVIFRGLANPPDEITETWLRLTFANRLSLQRVLLPDTRIQRRCAWAFPGTEAQRGEAVNGGSKGSYSPFYRCGYSPDQTGGCGTGSFSSCDYTRKQCEERGMFAQDSEGRHTRRFGGAEFVPSSILVKSYGDKQLHVSSAVDNEAKYNDFVPMVYGRGWYRPPVVFARNDGNLTRMEVLLGIGEMQGVVKVVVNGIELPSGVTGTNMTGSGWYNVISAGNRTGAFNGDFSRPDGTAAGDPYGSMALLSVVVPNRISDGSSLPRIEVLADGLKLPAYDASGEFIANSYTNNPAWILLDVMRRSGWETSELDMPSFARTAAYCAETIETTDLNGNPKQAPRFQCNLVIRKRRSAADVIRGIRNGSGLYLTYGANGLLELRAECSLQIQQVSKPVTSNSTQMLNGGWPAYEFGDGASGLSDILRKSSGEPCVRLWSRSSADTPNRYTIEFQDEFNEYQQDSLSLVDYEDALATGQELSATLPALGIPNFNQAGRVMKLHLNKGLRGNTFIEFETGLRAIGLKPGDLIAISYLKEGFERQSFRIIRLSPGMNYRTAVITAQLHDDSWYQGSGEDLGLMGGGRQPSFEIGLPRPLLGSILDEDGGSHFAVTENSPADGDGIYNVALSVEFAVPQQPSSSGPAIPLLSLAAQTNASGGTLKGGRSYYYAVTALDADGDESAPSFVVRAFVPSGSSANQVTINDISCAPGTTAIHVYRGATPLQLMRIASSQPLSSNFTDAGADPELASPPDKNYHHANFYWRFELLPETPVTLHSDNSAGNGILEMIPNEYRGKTIRITAGTGKGQERAIGSNTESMIVTVLEWEVEPNSTSKFVVAESAWQFGAVAEASPASWTVPNQVYTGITFRAGLQMRMTRRLRTSCLRLRGTRSAGGLRTPMFRESRSSA